MDEVTSVEHDFLGGAPSLRDALLNDEATDARALQRFASVKPQLTPPVTVLVDLMATLAPVDCGPDLAKHEAAFEPGTRGWVFADVEAWAALPPDHPNRRVFWLKGTGGFGKSVIAAQLVQRYGGAEVAAALPVRAYFFCKHDDTARNDPRRVVASLAFRLAACFPAMADALRPRLADEAVRAQLAGEGSFDDLYRAVLAEPLTAALAATPTAGDVVILVDALDELHEGASRTQLLKLVGQQLPQLPPRVRLVVSSRPEDDIVAHFRRLTPYVIHKQDEKQLGDLRLFAERVIVGGTSLRQVDATVAAALVNTLVERADGVFLALRLIARALTEREAELAGARALSEADVRALLASRANLVDGSYADTLARIDTRLTEAAHGDASVLAELRAALRQILAALLAARQPLLRSEVHELCGGAVARGERLTSQLLGTLSLLFSAASDASPVEPLHKTVVDYLKDQRRSGSNHVDTREGDAALALAALRVLRERDLLGPDAAPRLVQLDAVAQDGAVLYAIKHGHVHLAACAGENAPCGCAEAVRAWADAFLAPRVMPEVLPAGYTLSASAATADFARWLLLAAHTAGRKRQLVKELSELDDAFRGESELGKLVHEVARLYGSAWASKATIQGGVASMLVEAPATGCVHASPARTCLIAMNQCVPQVLRIPEVLTTGACVNSLAGHSGWVTSVAYSPDGRRIVSGSVDKTVRVWDAATGEALHTLEGHSSSVFSVAYSPDGRRIVSGSSDKTVRVWDAATGEALHTLEGHSDTVFSVAYSPDGRRIVSGSEDKTVRVWDAATGEALPALPADVETVGQPAKDSGGACCVLL